MPSWLRPLTVATLLGLFCFPVVAEELKCKYEERFKEGGSKGVDVRIGIVSGKIDTIVLYSFISSGKEGGGYVCGIDTSEKDQNIRWSATDKKTILEVEYDLPIEKSVLEIEKIGNSYKMNLENMSRSGCGFGADWGQSSKGSGHEKYLIWHGKLQFAPSESGL